MLMHIFLLLCVLFSLVFPHVLSAADGTPVAHGPRMQSSNGPWMAVLRNYAHTVNVPVTVHGAGAFRIITIGAVKLKKSKKLIATGLSSLAHLEQWAGSQALFAPHGSDEGSAYCIVLIENDSLFDEALAAM